MANEKEKEVPVDPNQKMKDYSAAAVDVTDIMTSLQGMIYNKIVGGGEAGASSEDNFFCWSTPGIPVTPQDFEFVSEGLRGTMRLDKVKADNLKAVTKAQAVVKAAVDKAIAELPEDSENKTATVDLTKTFVNLQLSEDDINTLRADKTFNLYLQAESLSHLVDFIPDVSGWKAEGGTKLQVMENEGSLSDVYMHTLTMSQVKADDIDDETKKKVEQYRAALETTVKQPPLLEGLPAEETTEPTRMVKMYTEKMNAYEDAALTYKLQQAEAMGGNDPLAMQRFALTAKILQNKVNAAMNDWIASGYKKQYEMIAAFIDQVESRSMVMQKEEYRRLLENAYMTSLGSGMQFLYTTLSPMNFVKAGSWQKITYHRSDYNYHNEQTATQNGFGVKVKTRSVVHKHETNVNHEEGTREGHMKITLDGFSMEFEICQVSIVRPWFKPSFLNSRYWRFTPGNKDENGNEYEILSDGEQNPKGMMPAYPTSIIFVRNLTISFSSSEEARDFEREFSDTSHGTSIGAGCFCFSGSVGYNYHDSTSSGSNDHQMHRSGSKITIKGMQIIGYRCHLLGKSPNPLPSITEWV